MQLFAELTTCSDLLVPPESDSYYSWGFILTKYPILGCGCGGRDRTHFLILYGLPEQMEEKRNTFSITVSKYII